MGSAMTYGISAYCVNIVIVTVVVLGGILRWKIDFAEMEIAAEMDNQDFDDGFI